MRLAVYFAHMPLRLGAAGLCPMVVGTVVLAGVSSWPPSLESQTAAAVGAASLMGGVLLVDNGLTTPLRRARVTLTAADGVARVTDADTESRYRFDAFPLGQYQVTAAKPDSYASATTRL